MKIWSSDQRNFFWLRIWRKCHRRSFVRIFQSITFIQRAILSNLLLQIQNSLFQMSTKTSEYSHGMLPSFDDEMIKKYLKVQAKRLFWASQKGQIPRRILVHWSAQVITHCAHYADLFTKFNCSRLSSRHCSPSSCNFPCQTAFMHRLIFISVSPFDLSSKLKNNRPFNEDHSIFSVFSKKGGHKSMQCLLWWFPNVSDVRK
jgi:hypothetical protein